MSDPYRAPSPPTHVTVARELIERSLRILESVSSVPTGTWPEVYAVRNELQRILESDEDAREQCGDCGAEILGYHACQGVPGGFGED
jgi:hypothetical protein